MIVAFHLTVLAISVYLIVKSSDSLVDLASGIGRKAGLNDYFIGSFLVGIGTSLPELFTSIAATNSGSPELVTPNIFGTVAANIGGGFGLGVLSLLFFVRMEDGRLRLFTKTHAMANGYLSFGHSNLVPVIFAVLSVVLTFLLSRDNVFDRFDAGLFGVLYLAFMGWQFYQSRDYQPPETPHPTKKEILHTSEQKSDLQRKAFWEVGPTVLCFILVVVIIIFAFPSLRAELIELAKGNLNFVIFIVGWLCLLGFQFWGLLARDTEAWRTGIFKYCRCLPPDWNPRIWLRDCCVVFQRSHRCRISCKTSQKIWELILEPSLQVLSPLVRLYPILWSRSMLPGAAGITSWLVTSSSPMCLMYF